MGVKTIVWKLALTLVFTFSKYLWSSYHIAGSCAKLQDGLEQIDTVLISMVLLPQNEDSESVTCSVMSDSWRPHGLCQAPLSLESSRQEYWSRLPFPSPEDLTDPGIELVSCIANRFFTV